MGSGRKPRPPTLDAFGRWVGEHVEAQFAGAAGTASRDMWKIKGENKLEFNRINFMTKSQTAAAEMVQFGYPEEDPMAAVKAAEEATTAAAAMRVAGVPSKSLYRKQRERDGLMDETGKPSLKEVPHPDRQQKITGGEAAPFAWPAPGEARAVVEEPTPEPVYRSSTPKGRRPVAGLTSKEVVEAYMPWAPKQGVMVRGEQGKLAKDAPSVAGEPRGGSRAHRGFGPLIRRPLVGRVRADPPRQLDALRAARRPL